MTTRAYVFVLAALVSACGGIATSPLDDGGTGKDGGPPPPHPSGCPATTPAQGSACSKQGLECEYGPDVRSTCNTIMACSNGSWLDMSADDLSCPTGPNPTACPATFEAAQSAGSCNDLGTSCNYSTSSATRFCSCIDWGGPVLVDGGSYGSWACTNSTQACPATRPRIGDTCSHPNLSCDYDACSAPSGLAFLCDATTGTWTIGPGELCASANSN